MQNALKFARPHTTVTLKVRASADRVLIDVRDEYGGLPGQLEGTDLFASFEQRAADRTGLGIGLACTGGVPKPAVAGSTPATSLRWDACLPWTCRDPSFRPSLSSSST